MSRLRDATKVFKVVQKKFIDLCRVLRRRHGIGGAPTNRRRGAPITKRRRGPQIDGGAAGAGL